MDKGFFRFEYTESYQLAKIQTNTNEVEMIYDEQDRTKEIILRTNGKEAISLDGSGFSTIGSQEF